jgi:predicted phage terminase large subunit-like protein
MENSSLEEQQLLSSQVTFEHLESLSSSLKDLADTYAKENFYTFIKRVVPSLVTDWKSGKHIKVIADKLQLMAEGKCPRLMVFLPPRSSKSVICSMLFPAWYIGHNPNHEIMSVSHSDELSSDFGRTVRDIVNSETYANIFSGVSLRQDVRAAGKWKTNLNGSYYAAGVRSKISGRGAHVAILDDVMSEHDAISSAGRKYIKEWWPVGIRTRLMPNGSVLIINTRYHYDDICGWLLRMQDENDVPSNMRWEVLSIPAWLDHHAARLLKLPVGSSYFPEWKPDYILKRDEEDIKSTNGTKYWESLYMQNPTPEEGSMIRREWIQWWDWEDPPNCDFIIQTLDTAFSTKDSADFSVIQTWGVFSMNDHYADTGEEKAFSNLILLGSVKERLEYPDLRRVSQEEYRKHRPDLVIVEKKASGQSLIQDLRRNGLPILEYTPDRDKVTRAYTASPLIEAGCIYLPKERDWAKDLLDELVLFPHGAHDDQVDAMVMAIHYVKDSWRMEHPEDPDWEDDQSRRRKKNRGYWQI